MLPIGGNESEQGSVHGARWSGAGRLSEWRARITGTLGAPFGMNLIQLESWVRDVCDRVTAKQPMEDARVELKRDWPVDHARAARRIAGHANAARGTDILWLIGVDEDAGVVGANSNDTAAWWTIVRSNFDEGAPNLLQDHVFDVEGQAVVALLFGTEGAPFIVRVAKAGNDIDREIPWREGTQIRTARRRDVIRVLSRAVAAPEAELLAAVVGFTPEVHRQRSYISVELEMFFTPRDDRLIVLPVHRASIRVEPNDGPEIICPSPRFYVSNTETTGAFSPSSATLTGPCRVILRGYGSSSGLGANELRVTATMPVAGDAPPVVVTAILTRDPSQRAAWRYPAPRAGEF